MNQIWMEGSLFKSLDYYCSFYGKNLWSKISIVFLSFSVILASG